MANIKDQVVQQNQAIIIKELNDNFKLMALALQNDKTTALTVVQSYMSEFDVVDELRKLVKDKTPPLIAPSLDSKKSIRDIVNDKSYPKLLEFLNKLKPADYEPPLALPFTSAGGVETYPYPNLPTKDPRRTGKLIKPGPVDSFKSPEVLKWIVNNSILYGFVLYADNGLYYLGVDKIKTQLKAASKQQEELKKIVGTFLKSADALKQLTTTAAAVISNTLPVGASPSAVPGNLDGTKCTEIKPGKFIHTGYEPQFKQGSHRAVRSIILHYTVGNGKAQHTIEYVGRCDGEFERGGIHYAVDRGGTVAAGIPEDVICVHGDNWNTYGIGIELSTYGGVTKQGNRWVNKAYATKQTIPDNEVVDLGFVYEGEQQFQDYTDIEIQKLEELLRGIIQRWPLIRNGIVGKNVWRYVFGLEGGKPKLGDHVKSQNGSDYGGYGQYGIFSHSTGGGTHTDIFPSPKMINMLIRLGYTQ